MIPNLQEKYALLSDSQKDIFAGYGLRQIKHFVEISLPTIEAVLSEGAIVQGINAEGKMQAYNPETGQYYLWISDLQWQTTQRASKAVDLKEDALEIWNIFDLKSYELSHVHRDFLQV